jgi:predicted GTPase
MAATPDRPRRVLVLGAGGRDFHDFNVALRDDPGVEVVAFTATQIPGIDDRRFPPELAGDRYPQGIPIRPESELEDLVTDHGVDEVVIAYSDLSHREVMHLASRALSRGADVRFLGPSSTAVDVPVPSVAVTATRTGAGKSQVSRWVALHYRDRGLIPAMVRHPMPYGDLLAQRVQRFARLEDLDAAACTIEEREEYEAPVRAGLVMWAGVDYVEILARAAAESDVVVWDGGNNDLPFVRADLDLCVLDPLRAGDELDSHPGEAVLRSADVVIVNKVDQATPEALQEVRRSVAALAPRATVIDAVSRVTLEDGPPLRGLPVVVVEDGPTLTHGGMPWGAGTVAALGAGAVVADARPHAVGALADAYRAHPHLGAALPALGYSPAQRADLAATIRATARAHGAVAVVTGTPIDLRHVLDVDLPVRHASYRFEQVAGPPLTELLDRVVGLGP